MRTYIGTIGLLLLAAMFSVMPAQAGTYISLKGDFYFDYPQEWIQVDHRIVDAHLLANKAGRSTLDYEAAFSPVTSVPFFSGPYFILSVDTAGGGFTQAEIDSAVADMGRKFGSKVRYFPVADFLADMKSDAPSYDEKTRTISVVSDIVERGEVVKRHLLVMRFLETGLATFYFYAPDSVFSQAQDVFQHVLDSFHAGNAEQMLPKETLRVADIKTNQPADSPQSGSKVVWVSVGIVVVLVGIIGLRAYRRRRS